jgi:Mn-dependent DtxR family transcriptional regulator
MHVLSTDDMEFLVTSANAGKIVVDNDKLKQRIDQLIRMGYVRPNNGQYYLTELGAKTARSLQFKFYDPNELNAHMPGIETVHVSETNPETEVALSHDADNVIDAPASEAAPE